MLESKYNPFIACFLHNCEEYLFPKTVTTTIYVSKND